MAGLVEVISAGRGASRSAIGDWWSSWGLCGVPRAGSPAAGLVLCGA